MALSFYNSLTRSVMPFTAIDERHSRVGMYSCGPTVYNPAHIGNFRAYIFSDITHRALRLAGYDVTLIMNITDVDDKTIKGANAEGVSLNEYTARYKKMFFEDIAALRILPAKAYPAATEHIPQMVSLIKTLIEKGHAYTAEDGAIYFRIASFPSYGRLANLKQDELRAGASGRVAADEYEKESISDFALWKSYDEADGGIYWETEIGKGRPGWHIECSAMSEAYLGAHFDIHTGGVDNKFPHHENEIAQSEAATGAPFVNYWLHCEHLIVDGEKMSKSKGNYYTLRDLLEKGMSPRAIRYALLSSHYRKKLDFSIKAVEDAGKAIERVNDLIFRLNDVTKDDDTSNEVIKNIDGYEAAFKNALFDDLNTAGALGALFEFVKTMNAEFHAIGRNARDRAIAFLKTADTVIDCFSFETERVLNADIEALIAERAEARKAKNFARSDEIRDALKAQGIELFDTPDGMKWKRM